MSRAWNDAKLGEHHGLIPTGTAPDWTSLSPVEQAVYRVVCERYVAQFMPLCQIDKAVVEVEAAGHRFVARGRVVRVAGWRVLFGASETPADTAKSAKLPPPPPGCEAKPRASDKPVPKDAKLCPKCGKGHLVQKTAKASGKTFMACTA